MKSDFKFYKLPQFLYVGEYKKLSHASKELYAMLLDRKSLSENNHFADENGNTVVVYSNQQVCEKLVCSPQTATKLFRELEQVGLIHRKRNGRGRSDYIYVANPPTSNNNHTKGISDKIKNTDFSVSWNETSHFKTTENCILESQKSSANQTEKNKTNHSQTDQSICYEDIEEAIKYQVEYDILIERNYGSVIEEIINMLTDAYCTTTKTIRIGKQDVSIEAFRNRVNRLTCEHIEYVLQRLEKNKSKINNMRSYVLTALYYSIDTMDIEGLYGN